MTKNLKACYYWLSIEKEATKLQKECPKYHLAFNNTKSISVTKIDDWKRLYKEYLSHKIAPYDKEKRKKLLKHINKYCLKDDNDN